MSESLISSTHDLEILAYILILLYEISQGYNTVQYRWRVLKLLSKLDNTELAARLSKTFDAEWINKSVTGSSIVLLERMVVSELQGA